MAAHASPAERPGRWYIIGIGHTAEPRRAADGRLSSGEKAVLWLLLGCVLLSSSAYGVLLLVGPFVKTVGGSEQTYGALCAAAAVPTAAALLLLLRFPRTVPANALLAGACTLYAAAAVVVASAHTLNVRLVVASVVLGTAWAVTYTAAPMIASDLATDLNRATLIGYATGTIQVGFGIGPVLGHALRSAGLSYQQVFLAGAALAVGAAVLVVPLTFALRRVAAAGRAATEQAATEQAATEQAATGAGEPTAGSADRAFTPVETPGDGAGTALAPESPPRAGPDPAAGRTGPTRGMLRSPSIVPLAMVLLCACVFTTMNSFQTTFADSHHLDFDVFYVTYTLAVIAVRLGLSRVLPDSASDRVVAVTTIGMTAAAVAFLFVGSNAVFYCLASLLLGCTYGLGLPAFQARAVNLAGPAERVRMLPMAGLLFEVAILVFPIVAGAIVRAGGYRGLFGVLVAITGLVMVLGQLRARPASVQARILAADGGGSAGGGSRKA